MFVSGERRARIEGLREPQRLSQQLSTLLAAEIVSGRIGVGEAFPSSEEIVSLYGVSRTVARETVQALRREGKAEPLLRDLYEFRLLIEPQAAAWMADHAKSNDLAELDALVDRMETLVAHAEVSVPEVMEADRSFHDLLARASDNHVLAAVSRDIREVIGTLWGFSNLDGADVERVALQHRRIADAVLARDARGAAAAMREHLQWAAQADLHGLGEPAELRFPDATVAD